MKKILAFLLIITAPLSLLWQTSQRSEHKKIGLSLQVDAADWFAEQIHSVIMDKQGQPKQRLAADKILHFNESNTTEFIRPIFKLYNENAQSWQLRSESGSAHHGQHLENIEKIDLWQGVELQQLPLNQPENMTVKTDYLQIYPNENRAETDHPVELKQTNHQMKAVGMKAYFDTEQIELLNQVQGRHHAATAQNS